MRKRRSELTDRQWEKIKQLIPERPFRPKGGRPPADDRLTLEGILWVARTGAPWADLPDRYPSPATCWRRLKLWQDQGVFKETWRAFLSMLDGKKALRWDDTFIDGSFAPAKKGGLGVGKTKRGKGTKWMIVVDGSGIPLGCLLDSASPAEVRLAEATLNDIHVPKTGKGRTRSRPKQVIADKAYDSDGLRASLKRRGITLISPYKKNRTHHKRQNQTIQKRYGKRWIVERTFAWIACFRRLVVRYEHHLSIYSAFFNLVCAMITLKKCMRF